MTAFLLRRLVRVCVSPGAKVLDFCCGNGAIAQAVVQLQPSAEVHLADADALAVRAACRNVPAARHGYLGDSWQGVPSEVTFDWIVSNPPVHRRRQDTWHATLGFFAQGRETMPRTSHAPGTNELKTPYKAWFLRTCPRSVEWCRPSLCYRILFQSVHFLGGVREVGVDIGEVSLSVK